MKIEQTKEITIEVEEITNLKCDICNKNLLKKNKGDTRGGSLVGFRLTTEDEKLVLEQNESSDFCEKCYDDMVSYLKEEKGAKIPSYYYNIELLDKSDEQNYDKRH